MKKLLCLLILSMSIHYLDARNNLCNSCDCKATSKTFFTIRPPFQLDSPERLTLFRDRMEMRTDGLGGAIQLTLFGGRSTKSDDLATYFLPHCKTRLKVVEDLTAITNGTETDVDIIAQHLNIYTANGNFKSTVEFKPRHSFVGLGIEYKQRLFECNGRTFWLRLATPLEWVKNRIDICEQIDTDNDSGGPNPDLAAQGVVANVVDAFNQSSWCCGKIDACGHCDDTKVRLADIELSLGYDFIKREDAHMSAFFGLLIPTGNRPKSQYLFEPIVGHNRHWGILFGSSLGIHLWSDGQEDKSLWFEYNGHCQYLFSRTERRMFDLKHKPWSRYMQVFNSFDQAQQANTLKASENPLEVARGMQLHTPGASVFCQDMDVKPGFSKTINSALIYTNCAFQAEVGYNFFARDSECVKLECDWPNDIALKDINNTLLQPGGQTTVVQTIGNIFTQFGQCSGVPFSQANYNATVITKNDLDLESAAHPAVLQHTLYASLGYRWDERKFPFFAGIGGSYEFSRDNTGMHRWMLWGKTGITF